MKVMPTWIEARDNMGIAENPFRKAIVVRLFRIWTMAREAGSTGLGRMHEITSELGLPDETASACASLFQLVEAELGRPLLRECCCARTFFADEVALIGVIEAAPSIATMKGTQDVPHGLPGAIRWAAMTVRRALDWPDPVRVDARLSGKKCPFSNTDGGAELAL